MKYIYLFLLLIAFGCTYDDVRNKDVANQEGIIQDCPPLANVEQYPWIMAHFAGGCVCVSDVFTSIYHGKPVIYIPCGGIACNCMPGMYLYDCQGQHVATLTTPDEQAELGTLVKIYSCTP